MQMPMEVIDSQIEIEEDQMLKLALGIDQMFIEEDGDGNEDDFDYVDLVRAPVSSASEAQYEAVKKQKFNRK